MSPSPASPPTSRPRLGIALACFAAGIVATLVVSRPGALPAVGSRPIGGDPIASAQAAGRPSPGTPGAARAPGIVELTDPRQAAQIETAVAGHGPIPLTGVLPARLVNDENATTRLTVPIDGRVLRLLKQVGDRVAAGEPIIEIDAPDLGQAIADAAKARADSAYKRANLARAEELFANQVLARKDLEAARADAASSEAELQRAELRLRALNGLGKVRGQVYLLASPLPGIVTERNATPGQQVNAGSGDVLAVVSDPARLTLLIDVPESEAVHLRVGMPIDFSVDSLPGRRFQATLTRLQPQVDIATRRVQARARIDNRDGVLRPEMFARALPSDGGAQATTVPASALLQFGARTIVFVAGSDGRYEQREVTLAAQRGQDAWIDSGVQPGDTVVTAGALLLKSELVGQ